MVDDHDFGCDFGDAAFHLRLRVLRRKICDLDNLAAIPPRLYCQLTGKPGCSERGSC
jgi:hypothetical protein